MNKLLFWLKKQLLELKRVASRNYLLSERGDSGGGESPPAPAPAPSPAETSAEAIQAQIDATPKILASQQEYGPQFTAQTLKELEEFGPGFAQAAMDLSKEFGPQFAQQVRDEQAILAPERVAGSEAITKFLEEGPGELTDIEKRQIEQDSLSARSATGMGESGMTADEIVNRTFGARQALKNRYLDVGLSASGRLPAAGGQTVGTPTGAVSNQLIQNVTPGDVFGGQASNNAFNASIYGTQANIYGTQSQQQSPFGAIVGGLAGSVLGGFGGTVGAAAGGAMTKGWV